MIVKMLYWAIFEAIVDILYLEAEFLYQLRCIYFEMGMTLN
jgi:hypothetical protein